MAQPPGQQPGPERVPRRVHLGQGTADQRDRPLGAAGVGGRLGGPSEQLDPVEARRRGWGPLPQLQRTLEVVLGLGEGVAPLGGQAGLDRGRQGPRQVVGGVPVPGQLRGKRRVGTGVARVRLAEPGAARRQRAGQAAVQAGPLAGQEPAVN